MVLRAFSTAIVLIFAVTAAQAQKRPEYLDGIYVGGNVGVHKPQNSSMARNGQTSTVKIGAGAAGTAAIGYGFGNGLRGELELGHRAGSVRGVDNATGAAGGGRIDVSSLMANVLYDFANETSFVPYLGAGIGGARLRAKDVGPDQGNAFVSGAANVFAYQGIVGLDYRIGDNMALGASYRYFATQSASIGSTAGDSASIPYRDHSIVIGMRYAFNPTIAVPAAMPAAAAQPVAAPPPPAASQPPALAAAPIVGPRAFTVFFEFDKSNVSEDANRVLVQAAESAKAGIFTRIRATGHADTMGTPRYNMALSIRRANAVRDVLVREGIPATQIVVIGRGETQLLVPTPDQINEPRNRRVEIVIE
ncbi:MAG: OmpA family protein [Rhodospirillales bacterium]|nr:OmpA family protein [Rhodospirillales bacterium]